jgi:hypothetical protein
MFQMFYLFQTYIASVAKVDLDVTYICMLQAYVSSVSGVSYVCCKCFIWMYVWFSSVFRRFPQVIQTLVSNVSSVFFYMLQLVYLDVSKIDWVLRMGCAWKAVGGAGDVWGGTGSLLWRLLVSLTRCGHVRTLASRIERSGTSKSVS